MMEARDMEPVAFADTPDGYPCWCVTCAREKYGDLAVSLATASRDSACAPVWRWQVDWADDEGDDEDDPPESCEGCGKRLAEEPSARAAA